MSIKWSLCLTKNSKWVDAGHVGWQFTQTGFELPLRVWVITGSNEEEGIDRVIGEQDS